MKLLSWNIRGCNCPLKKRLLKQKINIEKLAIVFLQETKCNSEEMDKISKGAWKGAMVAARDAEGVARAFSLLWNPNLVSISNLCNTSFSIYGRFNILGSDIKGVVTNVYGPFQPSKKSAFLSNLESLKEWVENDHWLIGGDFNIIRSLEEKKGGVRAISATSTLFNKFIDEMKLVDIRSTNRLFTWQNKQSRERHIASRLNWFLVFESVLAGRGDIGAIVFPATGSDHWPIFLEWGNLGDFINRPFRFENFWLQHQDIHRLMKEWWENCPNIEGSRMFVFQQKLKYIKECVKKWNKESFGNIL